jgi:hypothetical protein
LFVAVLKARRRWVWRTDDTRGALIDSAAAAAYAQANKSRRWFNVS